MAYTELTDEQLVQKIVATERELVAKRFQHSMQQLENTAGLKVLRREIARLKTETRNREKDQELPKGALIQRFGVVSASAAGDSAAPEEKGKFLSGIVDMLTNKE